VRGFCLAVLLVVMCLRVVAYATAEGANPPYLGAWTLADAAAAPWSDRSQQPEPAERGRLLGQTVEFRPDAVTGPPPFACAAPHYRFRDVTAAALFHGAFGAMAASDRSRDPDLSASALGFVGPTIKTLETGCNVAIHFVDAATAQVSVSNVIFTLRKQ
jgi:hypothetical protein